MIAALADASQMRSRVADTDDGERYRDAATTAADMLLRSLRAPDGRLGRSWKDGRASQNGVLEDYTHLADGLLALYEATFDERWFTAARELMEYVLAHFGDPAGGFFDTSDQHEPLITRPKSLQDNALPSGNAMAAFVLLRLAALTGEGRYRDAAEKTLALVGTLPARYPAAFAQWLVALDFALADVREIAIVGDPAGSDVAALLDVALRGFQPWQVVAVGSNGRSAVPLLEGRSRTNGRATAYVCRNFACNRPVTDPVELAEQLAAT